MIWLQIDFHVNTSCILSRPSFVYTFSFLRNRNMILGANYMKKHWLSAYQDKFAYLPAFKWKQPTANISSRIFFFKNLLTNSTKVYFMYQQWTPTADLFLKVSITDYLDFFSKANFKICYFDANSNFWYCRYFRVFPIFVLHIYLQKIKIFKTFQRQIWKMISASRINLFTQIIGPLKFDMVTAAMFIFCQLSKHVQAQKKHSISFHVLVHLDCDYMEVDQPSYQTG